MFDSKMYFVAKYIQYILILNLNKYGGVFWIPETYPNKRYLQANEQIIVGHILL